MADVRTNPAEIPAETPPSPTHATIRREDYQPPEWLVPEISLDFALDPEATRVRATLQVVRNGDHRNPIRLDSDELTPRTVRVDGQDAKWRMEGDQLVIEVAGDRATIETEVVIDPTANTKLSGLYASGGMLCTQCEAEGFRRITFFPDRPDVLSRYRVRLEGDEARFPILLTNGNPLTTGKGE